MSIVVNGEMTVESFTEYGVALEDGVVLDCEDRAEAEELDSEAVVSRQWFATEWKGDELPGPGKS
jgi:hypothetical protein